MDTKSYPIYNHWTSKWSVLFTVYLSALMELCNSALIITGRQAGGLFRIVFFFFDEASVRQHICCSWVFSAVFGGGKSWQVSKGKHKSVIIPCCHREGVVKHWGCSEQAFRSFLPYILFNAFFPIVFIWL